MGCKGCGACCRWSGYVHLSDKDIKRVSSFLGMSDRDFVDEYTQVTDNRQGLSIIEKEDGNCIFYNESKKNCDIYGARPKQCRDFPYRWQVKSMKECSFYS